jgi:hypothetical protein
MVLTCPVDLNLQQHQYKDLRSSQNEPYHISALLEYAENELNMSLLVCCCSTNRRYMDTDCRVQAWKKLTLTKMFKFQHKENSTTCFLFWECYHTARNNISNTGKILCFEGNLTVKMGVVTISSMFETQPTATWCHHPQIQPTTTSAITHKYSLNCQCHHPQIQPTTTSAITHKYSLQLPVPSPTNTAYNYQCHHAQIQPTTTSVITHKYSLQLPVPSPTNTAYNYQCHHPQIQPTATSAITHRINTEPLWKSQILKQTNLKDGTELLREALYLKNLINIKISYSRFPERRTIQGSRCAPRIFPLVGG